jgi:hypothetical protein
MAYATHVLMMLFERLLYLVCTLLMFTLSSSVVVCRK